MGRFLAGATLCVLSGSFPAFAQICTGLCLQQVTCPANGTTSVSGKVYAPNGTDFLPNVYVYVPNGGSAPSYGVTAFPPGATNGPINPSGSPLVGAVSAINGTFTITDVPVGTNIPLVIQAGKWRRKITIPDVPSCVNTTLTVAQTSFPTTQGQGDPADNIPLIAVSTGADDVLECELRKIGIADSQFSNPASLGGAGRVNLYLGEANGGGAEIDGSTPSATQLWGTQAAINAYDMVLFPCQGIESLKTAAQQSVVINYANSGGRIFSTHYSYGWLINPNPNTVTNPFFATANWATGGTPPTPDPQTAFVDQAFTEGSQLAQWMQDVGASTTLGRISLNTLRNDFTSVVAPSQLWLTLGAAAPGAFTFPMQYTFNTPVGSPASQQFGRVLFNDYHVFNAAITPGTAFPTECPVGAMTPQQKLLEFILFDLATNVIPNVASVGLTFTNAPTSFTAGDSADTIQINVANTSIYLAADSSLTFSLTSLGGLTPVAMAGTNAGTGWTCVVGTLTCTRTTPLAIGATDPVTVTVSVPAGLVPVTGQIIASVAGGGLPAAVTSQETVTVNPSYTLINTLKISTVGPTYNRATKLYYVTVTIKNTGGSTISSPIELVFGSLPGGVTLSNSAGTAPGGSPYLSIASPLAAGASTSVSAQFANPSNLLIPISISAYSGVF